MLNDMVYVFLKYFSRALMLLLVLPVTNCVRGLVAKKLGDDTADRAGRITLNPLAHLDMFGSLAILLIGFGWSKPMPINYNRFRDRNKGIVILAITGPLSYFVSAIITLNIGALAGTFISGIAGIAISYIFVTLASINTCLGVINILPIPPMDGFTVLYHLAGRKFVGWYHKNQRMIDQASLILILFLFFIGDITRGKIDPLARLIGWVFSLLTRTTFWIDLLN